MQLDNGHDVIFQRASSRSLHSGHVWLRSSQFSKHFSWNLSARTSSDRTHRIEKKKNVRMLTGRPQDTPIPFLELRHANRTLFHGHAQQGHLQLDTPIPRHPFSHELDLAHKIRRFRARLLSVRVIVYQWRWNTGWWRRGGPKEVRNEEKRLASKFRSCRTSPNHRQSENSRHN